MYFNIDQMTKLLLIFIQNNQCFFSDWVALKRAVFSVLDAWKTVNLENKR